MNSLKKPPPVSRACAHLVFFAGVLGSCFAGVGNAQVIADAPPTDLRAGELDIAQADYAAELERVRTLIKANVLALSETILETRGPPETPSEIWVDWQRQLWQLYRIQGKWQALQERTEKIPTWFPATIRNPAELYRIEALIALNQGAHARRLLRAALLAAEADEQHHRRLRQRVVESYLADDNIVAAQAAMRQFQHDYRSQEPDWLLLNARIHLRLNQADAAVNLLAPLDTPPAKLLRLYARLQNGSLDAAAVIEQGLDFYARNTNQELKKPLLAILLAAHRQANKRYPQVDLLEEYLSLDGPGSTLLSRVLPDFDVQSLLQTYRAVALEQGNRAGLLVGEEAKWLEYAHRVEAGATVIKRCLFAYIAQSAQQKSVRQSARDAFVDILIDLKRTDLIAQVFRPGSALGPLALSGRVGLRLANHALEQGDIQLSADANENLLQLPPDIDRIDWLLHSARIAIIAGRYQPGEHRLTEWLDAFDQLLPEQTDQVLQLVFDLQAVEQHALALPLLLRINRMSDSARYRREIAYWIGESYFGIGHYVQAADYFLYSALQKDNGFDQWGEAARFKAAESLVQANLFDDAKNLFADLLARATGERRKTVLKQKLQQLLLQQSKPKPKPGKRVGEGLG